MNIKEKLQLLDKVLNTKKEIKADAMDTQETWAGAEFIDTWISTTILEKVRNAQTLLGRLHSPIMMPTSSYILPTEWADPTFYATAENTESPWTEYTASNAGTGSITLTAKKLSAITYLSWELDEDSIVAIRPYVENKIAEAYKEVLDKSILNWDTTTGATGNVNSDDWAPTAWSYFLHYDWCRKSAIDNSKTVNAWTLDATDFRDARALLWTKWLNPDNLIWAINTETYYKLLSLTQLETIEKFWNNATIVNWVLKAIDWIEILPHSWLWLTEADGKISTTAGNNTLWQWVLMYKPDIITWFRRKLKINISYVDKTDMIRITAHTRFAVKIKDTDSVSSLINITV